MYKYSLILAISALCAFSQNTYCHVVKSVAQTSRAVRPIINHIRVIREFKQRHAKKRIPSCISLQAASRTQTEAYLAKPELKQKVESCWRYELQKHETLIADILAREKEYASTHYVFYHGQRGNLRILQDIIKELFMLFNLPEHACDNFVFLRDWTQGSTAHDVTTFMDAADAMHMGYWNNYTADFMNYLLSVNVSLFGNLSERYCNECTFSFFITNFSCYISDSQILTDLINAFGLSVMHGIKFYNRINDHRFDQGQLLQIFIPKPSINCYVYRSFAGGVPFGRVDRYIPETYEFKYQRDPSACILSTALEQYINGSLDAHVMDTMQARILITPAILDPANDIHIHRYQLSLTPEEEAEYEEEIKRLVHALVTEAYAAGTLKVPAKCTAERLLQYMQRTP
jgi:hypothetical protein